MRLFVGLPVKADLGPLLAHAPAGIRAVPDGSWHVTLRFLGDTAPAPVVAALADALADATALRARIAGVGAFSAPRKARILWARVEGEGIEALAQKVVEATRSFGEPPETRAFRPHATLARARDPVDARAWRRVHEQPFWSGLLDEVVLYRSEPGPEGATYTAEASWALPEP